MTGGNGNEHPTSNENAERRTLKQSGDRLKRSESSDRRERQRTPNTHRFSAFLLAVSMLRYSIAINCHFLVALF